MARRALQANLFARRCRQLFGREAADDSHTKRSLRQPFFTFPSLCLTDALSFFNSDRGLHALVLVTVHRAGKPVGASLEIHSQLRAFTGLYLVAKLLDAFSLDFQCMGSLTGVHGLQHIDAGLL